ncbi:MAG: ThiF family adenylyltransferase [Bdellovibrionales bacterium]|nr:ThiF family adenylyltransferase [Bdellovibrionales bacterium]
MKWVLQSPKRFLQERDDLDALAKDVDWVEALHWRMDGEFVVQVDIDLRVHGKVYSVTLTYPEFFPHTPGFVFPRDRSEIWSQHQYGAGGALCLEWRADNWNTSVTGADLIRSTYKLLHTEHNPEVPASVQSAHSVTCGQELRSKNHRFVVTPELRAFFEQLPADTVVPLKTNNLLHSSTTVAFVSGAELNGGSIKITDLPSGLSSYTPLFAWKGVGMALRSEILEKIGPVASKDDLIREIGRAVPADTFSLNRDPGSTTFQDTIVLLKGESETSLRAFGVREDSVHEYAVILPDTATRRLPVEYERLQQTKFAIIGLGSIGSKIAISLARAGVRNFVLVDDDVLSAENICRNELSWASVGVHKAEAVREALNLIAPNLSIEVHLHRVAGQESSIAAVRRLKEIGGCDVIVDATANSKVFVTLAAVARAKSRTLCWGEIYAGGIGGLIARARPGRDPNPLAVRDSINEYLETLPPAPFKEAAGYDVEDGQPLVADDADITHIASALTRLALDSALTSEQSSFPYSAYLIGLRGIWVFEQPFDTQPISVEGEGWTENSQDIGSDDDRLAATTALLGMIGGGSDDNSSPSI